MLHELGALVNFHNEIAKLLWIGIKRLQAVNERINEAFNLILYIFFQNIIVKRIDSI